MATVVHIQYPSGAPIVRISRDTHVDKHASKVLEEFPAVPMADKLGKHDIISLIVDPILRPLLSCKRSRLRWPEVNAASLPNSRIERLDSIISEIQDIQFTRSHAYGEAKGEEADNRSIAVDFVRLAIFGKDCIDYHKLNKVLLFQMIGCKITFYVEALVDEEVYILAELQKVTRPSSLREAPSFVRDLDALLDVFRTLETTAPVLKEEDWQKNYRETLDTPRFRAAKDKSRTKRVCLVHL